MDQFALLNKLGIDKDSIFRRTQISGKVGSWIYAPAYREYWMSASARRLFGVKSDACVTKELILSKVHPEDEGLLRRRTRNLKSRYPSYMVFRILEKGKIKWIEQKMQLCKGKTKSDNYILGTVREITWLKKEQEKLKMKSQGFSAINNYLAETTNSTNLDSIVLSADKTIHRLMDVAMIALFLRLDGKMMQIVPHSTPSNLVFQGEDERASLAYSVMKTGKSEQCAAGKYPEKIAAALLEQGIKQIVSFPVKDNGKIFAALSVALKYDGEMKAEEYEFCRTICGYLSPQIKNAQLYRSLKKELEDRSRLESDMDTIFNESVDFISMLDEDKRFTRVNQALCNRLGYTKWEMIGVELSKFVFPEDREITENVMASLKTRGVVRGFSNRLVCKNGEVVSLETNVKYVKETQKIIAVGRDVTEQREIEARNLELEKTVALEKLKSEFFANMSHEFKTPLNIIISSLDLIKLKLTREGEEKFEETYRKFFDYAYQNCYKLLRLTANLLDSSRIESKYYETRLSKCNFASLLNEIVESTRGYAAAKKVNIRFQPRIASDGIAYCDVDKIDRIMLNLISNAIKYNRVGGDILVTLSEDHQYYQVAVEDTGMGVPENVLPLIFDKYQVATNGLTRSSEGSGVGLFIAKSLVEMHGGTIGVESEAGKGSCFTFTVDKGLSGRAGPINGADVQSFSEMRKSRIKIEMSNID